jgi:hypothetical protein
VNEAFFVTPRFLPQDLTDRSAAKSSFIHREVDVWGSPRSLRTSLAGATARLSQQGAKVADLQLFCTDLRAEAAAARAEAQQQRLEFVQVVEERDQSRDRAAEAESRAEALAADLAAAQVAASEQRARAGGTPWPSLVLVLVCFLRLCLRSFFWLFIELESALDESAKALAEALAGAAEQREADLAAMSEAVSDVYQILGSGDVPSGSSPQSRLQDLGDHAHGRVHEALHHGVRRAFAVLASHYVVDLERVSEGYCLPDEDEAALAEVQRLDAVAVGPSAVLATTFEAEILPPAPSPEAEMDLTEDGDGAEGAAPSQGDA